MENKNEYPLFPELTKQGKQIEKLIMKTYRENRINALEKLLNEQLCQYNVVERNIIKTKVK